MMLGFLTGASATGPNLGILYDCKAAVMKGIFAAPSEKACMESFKSNKLIKFEAEVRK